MNPFEAFGLWLSGVLAAVLDFVIAIGPLWGAFFATLAIFLETTLFVGIVVPGDTVVMTAATAVHSPGYYLLLLGCVIAGTLGGQSVGFALGRWWGPAIRRSWLGRRLGDATWERAARYVGRRGGIAVFVSRFLPVLHALMPVTVGMSPMPYRRFIAWAAPAALIWAVAYVSIGTFAGAAFRALLVSGMHYAGYVLAGLVIVFFLVVWIVKRRLARTEGPEADADRDGRIDLDVR